MGTRLLMYLTILLIGTVIGYSKSNNTTKNLSKIQNISLFFLLFIMGMKMGLDKNVIASFLDLGLQAIIISIFSVLLSILFVYIGRVYFIKHTQKEVDNIER